MKLSIALLSAAVALAQSPGQDGFLHWPAAKLKGYSATLKAKQPTVQGNRKVNMASEQLLNRGNHTVMVIRRDESGEPEVHAGWSDVFIPQEGEATIVYGGKVEGGRETGPGEIRGGKIVGGSSQKLAPGDAAIIPPGVPHQTIVDKGKSFTAMIIKVEKK